MRLIFLRSLYIFLGTVSLCLGIIGIVVPGLPATPFLLLTAALYLKSSKKLYNRFLNNKILGPYIIDYKKNGGLTKQHKIWAVVLMWIMVTISVTLFIANYTIKGIVVLAALIGTFVVTKIVPSAAKHGTEGENNKPIKRNICNRHHH